MSDFKFNDFKLNTVTELELETLDGIVAGTVTSGRAIVVDDAKSIDYMRVSTGGTLAIATGITWTVGTGNISAKFDEINYVAGVTIGVAASGKAMVTDNAKSINYVRLATGGTLGLATGVTWTIGTGNVTALVDEINYVAGVVAGTVTSGKAMVTDDANSVNYARIATAGTLSMATGITLTLGTGNITALVDEINYVAGVTIGIAASGKALVADDAKSIDYVRIATAGNLAMATGITITMGTSTITALVDEINYVAGVVAGTITSGKAVVTDDANSVNYVRLATAGTIALATGVTFTLGTSSMTATVDEINVLALVTPGTSASGKAVVFDDARSVDYIRIATAGNLVLATGDLLIMGTGTVHALAEEIDYLYGASAGLAVANKAVIAGSSGQVGALQINHLVLVTGTPVNATAATATYNFAIGSGTVEAQTLIIGSETYEFDFVGDGVTPTNIAVGTSGTGSASTSVVTYLVSAITNSSTLVTAWTGALETDLAIMWLVSGATGNSYIVSSTITNGSWVASALAGGVDGTVASAGGIWYADSSYLYYATDANSIIDKNWRRISVGSSY